MKIKHIFLLTILTLMLTATALAHNQHNQDVEVYVFPSYQDVQESTHSMKAERNADEHKIKLIHNSDLALHHSYNWGSAVPIAEYRYSIKPNADLHVYYSRNLYHANNYYHGLEHSYTDQLYYHDAPFQDHNYYKRKYYNAREELYNARWRWN